MLATAGLVFLLTRHESKDENSWNLERIGEKAKIRVAPTKTKLAVSKIPSTPNGELEMEGLREAIADLKVKLNSLPQPGLLPSEAALLEMRRLVTEVEQPNWHGQGKVRSWLEGQLNSNGEENGVWDEIAGKKRQKQYSDAVKLITKREFTKLFQDPNSSRLAYAYMRRIVSGLENMISTNPELAFKHYAFHKSREYGIFTDSTLTPEEYSSIIASLRDNASTEDTSARLRALDIPEFVEEFIEDRARATIFAGGIADTIPVKNPDIRQNLSQ